MLAALLLAAAIPTLTDAQLVARATAPFDKGTMMQRHEVLGLYHGHRVLADYPCSDLCPAYTVRIVHFDVPPDARCAAAGGVIEQRTVPVSIAVMRQPFCIPRPLAGRSGE